MTGPPLGRLFAVAVAGLVLAFAGGAQAAPKPTTSVADVAGGPKAMRLQSLRAHA